MRDRCEEEIPLRRSSRQRAGRPKEEAEPELPRIPRVARLMALAIKFQEMIDCGEVRDYADLARLGYVTRARVTQIMNLLLLAPDIQCAILTKVAINRPRHSAHERVIRAVVRLPLWADQRKTWARIEAANRSTGCSTQRGRFGGSTSIAEPHPAKPKSSISASDVARACKLSTP